MTFRTSFRMPFRITRDFRAGVYPRPRSTLRDTSRGLLEGYKGDLKGNLEVDLEGLFVKCTLESSSGQVRSGLFTAQI